MSDQQHEALIDSRLEDAHARLRYQHEYALQGFKTLTLINGGAIIALLTYAGHNPGTEFAQQMANTFLAYTAGLITAVLAYLAAYLSQSSLMNSDVLEAYRLLGVEARSKKTGDQLEQSGMRAVGWGIALSVVSLCAFIVGSWLAMRAIS